MISGSHYRTTEMHASLSRAASYAADASREAAELACQQMSHCCAWHAMEGER